MPDLIIGLDPLAQLRDLRRAAEPDPASAALLAEIGGAAGLSVSVRAERRQSQERDAKVLRATVKTRLQLRIAATLESVKLVAPIRPDVVVLVPERQDAAGNEMALDLNVAGPAVSEAATALKEAGLEGLALVEPDVEQVKHAHRCGLAGVALLGSRLGAARLAEGEVRELEALDRAAKLATRLGLVAQVSHGLSLRAASLVARIPGLTSVEVGHAACARAVLVGMERAVRDFREAMR